MAASYIVREEDGTSKLILEDASGDLETEESLGAWVEPEQDAQIFVCATTALETFTGTMVEPAQSGRLILTASHRTETFISPGTGDSAVLLLL